MLDRSLRPEESSTTFSAERNESYAYDPVRRLTNAVVTSQGATNTLSYGYDNQGNRLQQSVNGATTNYSYNYTVPNYNTANDELISSTAPGVSVSYAYDANGNLATRSVTTGGTVSWAYAWDAANHLLKVTSNGLVQGIYAYDGMGRRVESIESTQLFYAYAGTETLWQHDPNHGSIDFLYAAGMKIATVDSYSCAYCIVKYYHLDALGSTRLVTSSSGSVSFADGYQPFGQDNGTPNNSENYKFTGKPYSSATGLYYDYQRWYDPSIGRFIS